MVDRVCRVCAAGTTDAVPPGWHDEDLCTGCADYLYENPIFDELGEERFRQDRRWGGPAQDDKHTPREWRAIIHRLLDEAAIADIRGQPGDYRRVMIQVGATAVAAVESADRLGGGGS